MVCPLSSRTTQLKSAAEEKVQSKPGEDGEATGINIYSLALARAFWRSRGDIYYRWTHRWPSDPVSVNFVS